MLNKLYSAFKGSTPVPSVTTKAITDSVGAISTQGGSAHSMVANASYDRALNVKQAYEVNPTARRCINLLGDSASKAQIRFFSRKSGDEIEAGDVVTLFSRPSKYMSGCEFISQLDKWYSIAGEYAVLPLISKTGTKPSALKVLDPTRLMPNPPGVKGLEFVSSWHYHDGMAVNNTQPILNIPGQLLAFAKNFNPYSDLRGSSVLISLVNEISTNYYVQRYNISRFKNGCKGDLVFTFPDGTKQGFIQDFLERWEEGHSIHNDNGFKISAIIGTGTEITQLDIGGKDGEYLKLSEYNDERITSGFGIPSSLVGLSRGTSLFDSTEAEQEWFTENTLLPRLRQHSEFLQTQIVDPYFPHSSGTKKKTRKSMSKMARKEYERAMDSYVDSDVIVMLDPDTLPIMAKLNLSRVKQAKEIREALDLSATEAAEYVGLDIPHNVLRDDIWVPSGRNKLTEVIAQPDPARAEIEEEVRTLKAQLSELTLEETPDPRLNDLKKFYRDYRNEVVKSFSQDQLFDKDTWISRIKEIDPGLEVNVHADYLAVRQMQDVQAVKDYFKEMVKPSTLRTLLEGLH